LAVGDLLHALRNPSLQTGAAFGLSTAVSEGLLVVGSPAADRNATNDGSVQVFDADSGVLLRELRNPTPADNDYFGFSVAISGSLVVIGAHNDDAGATDAGAAYVFDANTGNLLRTLSNPTPAASDAFGYSVDISGSTVVVGAFGDDTGAPNAGSVYVFDVTTGELWQTLNKPTPAVGDSFGWSVAISGSMVVAGAINDDTGAPDTGSVYVFDATAGNLLRTLNNPTPATSDQFGNSVAISGNTVAVGASRDDAGALNAGSAYVFDAATGSLLRTLTNPAPAATDEFGSSVAISAGRVAVGAYFDDSGATDAGSAYVFDATTGSLLQTIGNPAPAASDYFGKSVAISESKILVGASGDDVGATNTGSAFLFDAATGNPLHTLIMPMPPTSDDFGRSVALSGNRLVAGATRNDMGATDSGLAFVYDATTGSLLRTLYNPTPATLDNFGYSVAMSGGIVLVGAYQDDTGAQNAGAAYLFDEATGNLLRTLNNPAPDSSDHFGYSVAISGTTVVVGAPYDDTSATNAGSAYLFDAATGNLLRTLNYPVPASSGSFGISVAISGTTVVVGAPSHDAGAPYAGCVYLFDVNTGNLLQTLSKPTPAIYDNFGEAVAISGTTVIVGTRYDNTGAMDAGAVYLFDADTGNLLRTLSNPTPADSDNFGESVAISGATVIVGTPYDDTGAINAGSAYVFDAATGALLATVPNPAPQSGDNFGRSLAAWGDVFAVGAPADDDGAVDTGSAYLFAGATTPVNSPATITGTAAGSLAENAVSNATGGTLTVTDADAGQALFQSPSAASLVGTYGVFTFNPTTGVWDYTLDNGNPATDLLNAGQQVSETLTVVSLDGTARQAIVLTISGADDAPWFTSPATAWLAENTATVLTLSASDHDLPAQTVTFSITGGADGDRFHITGGSQLEFRVPPDFETRGDVGGDVDYEVEVTATDSGNPPGSTSQLLRVRVTPVNDNFPAFTSPDSPRLGENTTAVLTLAASDADLPPQTLTFAITGGVDRDLFQLANGNQLEFRAAPVHDTPLDADRDNVYELEVLADDGNGLTTPQLVRVTILARPRANPGGPYETSEGTPVLLDASASTDPDSAAALLAYDWDLDYDGVTFQVDASGGAPSVLFTDDSLARTIAVRVTDPDGLADIATATVTVHNVPPTLHGLGGGPVAAGQEVAVFVHATDPADYEDSLLYEFDFDNDGTFETTGSGLGVGRYTFTATGNYTVSVRVSDGDGGVATASTTVDVLTTVSFTAASGTASEGSGMVTIQAELGEAQLTDVLVPLFVSGSAQAMSDFTPAVSAIVIAAGSLTGTVVLQVIDDFRSESTETVVLTIPTGWTGQTVLRGAVSEFTLSIADNEPAASPPVASAGGPYVVNEAEDIRLDASATTDTGQPTETLAFEWDLDYDQVTFQVDAIGPRPYVRFADNSAERTIAVRVGDSDGLTSLAMTTVRVDNVPPVITNAWSDSPVRTGTPVRISVNASDLAGASDPLLYEFDFDNSGNYETGNYDGIATHTYTSSGYYHVPIRVSDGDGGSATSSITVHVRTTVSFSVSSSTLAEEAAGPLLIWAELGEIQTHEIDEWLQFGGSASNSSDYTIHDIFLTIPAGSLMGSFPIVSVDDWRSDPGETIELRLLGSSNFVPGVTPVHTVTIIDNEPPASPPEAHAGGPYTIGENLELRLDASATTDSGQPTPTLSFEWDLDYDGTTFQADTHGMQPFSRFGEDFPARMIGVRVIDADGLSDIATTTLTVTNRPPIITYLSNSTLPGLVGPAGRGDAFYVTVRAADGPSDPVSIAFDFDNDGTMDEVHDPGSTNPTVVTSHSFSHTGSHIVTVRATDDEGDSVDGTTTVRVLPRISFTSSGQTVDEHPGGDVLITAELDEAFSEDIVVPLKTSGSADSFYDYRYVSPQISIPAGETRGTATVRIHDDPFLDPDEELVLTLQLPTNVLPGTFTTHTIRIIDDDRPPVAHAGGPYMAEEAALFTLDGSGSSDPNQSTNTLHYAWDLDYDGLTFDSDVIGIRPNARLSDSFSPRTIAVRVEDYGDAFDIATTTLEVVNLPPRILSITDDGPAAPGSELTVSVLASDPAGPHDPLTYEFDFDNDGVYEISNDTGAAGHAFPVNGNRVVGIRISDGDGGHAVSVTTVSVAP
jgi:VCBS repeat-containing protein